MPRDDEGDEISELMNIVKNEKNKFHFLIYPPANKHIPS